MCGCKNHGLIHNSYKSDQKKKTVWWDTAHVRPSLSPEVQWLSTHYHRDIRTVLLAASPSFIITCYYPSPSPVLVVQNEKTMKSPFVSTFAKMQII